MRLRSAARVALSCSLALACCVLGPGTSAALDEASPARAGAASGTASVSSGLPWEGRLQRPVRLRANEFLRPIAEHVRKGNFFGTSELVALLERTAQSIAARWPGSQLSVGELSAPRGGRLDGHHSHRSGRDADLGFFMRDEHGRSSHFWRFVAFGSKGTSLHTRRAFYFDDARNWALVSTMLRDPHAQVQYMFVAQPIRARLLMQGRRQGESPEILRAAAAVMVQPKAAHKHDNHFHVRVYCARDDRPECKDSAPYWPWYEGLPPGGQYAELPTIHWKTPSVATRQAAQPQRQDPPLGATSSRSVPSTARPL